MNHSKIYFQKLKRQEEMSKRQAQMQKEAQSQRREAAEKKWRDRKAEGAKSKRNSDGGPQGRDGSPPFIPERDTQRGNSPPIPAMRKAGGVQPAGGNTDNESEPDIGSDAASGAGLTTTATASEDDYEGDPRRQSEVWEGLAEV